MLAFLLVLYHSAQFHAGVAGFLAAALVDFQAFRAFKSLNDLESYAWGVAAWRWIQGFVAGALAGWVFPA